MDLAFDLYIEDLKNKEGSSISQKEILQQDLEKLDKKIGRLIDLRIEENIEEATFKEKHTKLLKEKVDLELMMSQVKEENLEITLELLEEYKQAREITLLQQDIDPDHIQFGLYEYSQYALKNGSDQEKREIVKAMVNNLYIQNRFVSSKPLSRNDTGIST